MRLKCRDVWLQRRDVDTKYFHQFYRHDLNTNSLQNLEDEEGNQIAGLKDLSSRGVSHFKTLYKEHERALIASMLNLLIIIHHLLMMNTDVFMNYLISIEAIKEEIRPMQHDKSHEPDGFLVEFFSCFLDIFQVVYWQS